MAPITTLYAAILAIIFFILSVRVVMSRTKHNVSLGMADSGHTLTKKVRVHANFAEYIPYTLLMMLLVEMHQSNVLLLHSVGVLLITGRILHIFAIDRVHPILAVRVIGMAMTFIAFVTLILSLLYFSL